MIRKLGVFLFCSLFFAITQAATLDRIVAVVNNDVITQSQLDQQIQIVQQQMPPDAPKISATQLRQKVLQHLIDVSLQKQIADKAGIKVTDADVDQAIGRIAQQNGATIDQLKAKVAEQGVSYEAYRNEIRTEIMLAQIQQKVAGSMISINDQQVKDAMALVKNQPVQKSTPNAYHVVDLLIALPDNPTSAQIASAEQKAQTLKTQLSGNTNTQQAAINQPGLQMEDLGWHSLNELPDLFVPYLQKMKSGDLAGPIRAPNGIHVIKLVEIQGGASTAIPPISSTLQTHVEHILLKPSNFESDTQVKARLEQLRASILSGKSFADVAAANSQDPVSAVKGGDLGWVRQGMLDPAFEAEMNKLQPGQLSEPVKSQFGWHLIEVLGRKNDSDAKTLLQDQARQYIYQKKFQEAVQTWIQGLRARSYIKIMDNS